MDLYKKCNACQEELELGLFSPHSECKLGVRNICKKCANAKNRIYYSRPEVKKQIQAYGKQRWANTEKTDELKEDRKLRLRKWRSENIEHANAWFASYKKQKRKNNAGFKLSENMRTRVKQALKKGRKCQKTMDLVGCSIKELKLHLESLWQEGMNWDNYGLYGWHVDHIMPCCSFDLTKKEEQLKCFHYTNLQPLWARENLAKRGRIPADLNNDSKASGQYQPQT